MKKLSDIVKPRSKKLLPLSYAGKDNPEVDKLIHEYNVQNGHEKPPPKQLRFKLKEDVDQRHPSDITDLGSATHGHIPTFHYPVINLHHHRLAPSIPYEQSQAEHKLYSNMPQTHYRGGLEPEHDGRQAIGNYTEDSSYLNKYLVGRHVGTANRDPGHERQVQNLLDVAKQHRTTAPVSIWSGVGAAHPGKHKDGLYLPAFTSSSTTLSSALGFSRSDRTDGPDTHPYVFASMHSLHAPMKLLHPDVARAAAPPTGFGSWMTAEDHKDKILGHLMNHPDNKEFFSRPDSFTYAVRPVKHLLRMHAPAGSHLIHVGQWSNHPHESELIVPPGSRLTHTGQTPDLYACGTLVHHVNLETPDLTGSRAHNDQLRFQF